MDFDNPKVYGDTSITDGLVLLFTFVNMILLVFVLFFVSVEDECGLSPVVPSFVPS